MSRKSGISFIVGGGSAELIPDTGMNNDSNRISVDETSTNLNTGTVFLGG